MSSFEQHLFGTGTLLVGPVGGSLTESDHKIGVIQSASLEIKFNKKDLQTTPGESMFPVDTALYGGQVSLKIDSNTFERALLEPLAGAVKSSAGGVDTYKIGKTAKPTFRRVEFHGKDTEERDVVVVLYKALAIGLPMRFKMEDFQDMSLEFEGYPSVDDDDNVCQIDLAQTAS